MGEVSSKNFGQVGVLHLLAGGSDEEGPGQQWWTGRPEERREVRPSGGVGPDEGVVSNSHHRTGASTEQGGSTPEEVEAGVGEAGWDPKSFPQ